MTTARSVLRHDDLVEVAYVAADGAELVAPLDQAWSVPFELVAPVREFGSFKGQRNFSGAWWFATAGEHVGFESWLERDHVMLMDFDREVVGLSSQPFWLSWSRRWPGSAACPGFLRPLPRRLSRRGRRAPRRADRTC